VAQKYPGREVGVTRHPQKISFSNLQKCLRNLLILHRRLPKQFRKFENKKLFAVTKLYQIFFFFFSCK